jgi:nucleoside-diphosphate-sugar epimerase
MQLLITGGAGLIGSHASGALGARGWRVTGIEKRDPLHERPIEEQGIAGLSGRSPGTRPPVEPHPAAPPGDVRRTFADITKVRRMRGYHPEISIEEGIPRFAE